MYGIWINIQRTESWYEGIFFYSFLKAHCLTTPASTSLLIMHSMVFSIHPLKSALVLLMHIPATPALHPPMQGQVSTWTVCSHEGLKFVHLAPCGSPNASGWGVRLGRLCQMGKHQENQHLSSLMLLLLPAVLRVVWINPKQRDWKLSSCDHLNTWSVLEVCFHLLATLRHLSSF